MLVEFVSVTSMLACLPVGFLTSGIYTLASVVVEFVTVTTLRASLLVPLRALLLYTAAAIFDELVSISLGSASMSVNVLACLWMFVALAVLRVEVPTVSLLGTCGLVGVLTSRRLCVFVAFAVFVAEEPALSLLFAGISIGRLASCGLRLRHGTVTVAPFIDPIARTLLVA
ncbi:MAG: hypothetical protein EOP48_18525 [Sphingobacteriales bacterium]|nr:MAG: hypothetical protein EOP48_18525 [Sphingobacteriales bacterium]